MPPPQPKVKLAPMTRNQGCLTLPGRSLWTWLCGLRGHRIGIDVGGNYCGCHCGRFQWGIVMSHPLVFVAWSLAVPIVYALFPSSDVAALIALLVWGFGVLVWIIVGDVEAHPK